MSITSSASHITKAGNIFIVAMSLFFCLIVRGDSGASEGMGRYSVKSEVNSLRLKYDDDDILVPLVKHKICIDYFIEGIKSDTRSRASSEEGLESLTQGLSDAITDLCLSDLDRLSFMDDGDISKYFTILYKYTSVYGQFIFLSSPSDRDILNEQLKSKLLDVLLHEPEDIDAAILKMKKLTTN